MASPRKRVTAPPGDPNTQRYCQVTKHVGEDFYSLNYSYGNGTDYPAMLNSMNDQDAIKEAAVLSGFNPADITIKEEGSNE